MHNDPTKTTDAVACRLDRPVVLLAPERSAFEAWCDARWGNCAHLHKSGTCGEWDAWRGCRDADIAQIESAANHMRENAAALRNWPDMEQEARARELAATYVDELAKLWLLERQLGEMHERHNGAGEAGRKASPRPAG